MAESFSAFGQAPKAEDRSQIQAMLKQYVIGQRVVGVDDGMEDVPDASGVEASEVVVYLENNICLVVRVVGVIADAGIGLGRVDEESDYYQQTDGQAPEAHGA